MYRYPHFLDWWVPYSHLSGRKGEECAVTCCQQRWSAEIKLLYNKTIFGRGFARTPLTELSTLFQTPKSDELGGDTSFLFSSLSPRDPMAPRSTFELVPPLLDQIVTPCIYLCTICYTVGSQLPIYIVMWDTCVGVHLAVLVSSFTHFCKWNNVPC